jgi:hypothetical protein
MSNYNNNSCKNFLSEARENASEKAAKEISHIFEKSNLNLWLKISKGETYARFLLELRPAYRRMLECEYLVYELSSHIDYLIEKENYLGDQAGELRAGIKSWELNKTWQPYSRFNITSKFLNEKEFKNKNGLINFIYSLFSKQKYSQNSSQEERAKQEISKVLISHNRKNFNWLHSISNYIISFFYFVCEWIMKGGLSIIIAIGLFGIVKRAGIPNDYISWIIALFSSISLVQIISKTVYNFYISSNGGLAKHINFLLISICIMEGILGYTALREIFPQQRALNGQTVDIIKQYKPEFFALSMSFTVANILFSIAKAKRYNSSLLRREKFLSLIEKKNDISETINYVIGEIQKSSINFERYKQEVNSLLYGGIHKSGLFPEISQLSKEMYGDISEMIPLSFDDLSQLLLNSSEPFNFSQNDVIKYGLMVTPDLDSKSLNNIINSLNK